VYKLETTLRKTTTRQQPTEEVILGFLYLNAGLLARGQFVFDNPVNLVKCIY
jgi:hypothetical protein